MIGAISRFYFSTIRKNIFLWVEECYRLLYKGECQENISPQTGSVRTVA